MADMSGKHAVEPQPTNWDKYGASGWQRPPDARDDQGRFLRYFGQLPNEIGVETTEEGFRTYLLDPITLTKNGGEIDGYTIRFSRASLKQYKGNKYGRSAAGDLIRAAGVLAKPQVVREYDAAMNQVRGKIVPFTIDWEARNKDTGEKIRGFNAFPLDPATGQRMAILHEGDTYNIVDEKGNLTGEQGVVTSEVLFANARLRFFSDPSKAKG